MRANPYPTMQPCTRAVVDAIAAVYGLHPSKLTRRGKESRGSRARSVAIFICRAELGMSLGEIAGEFGMCSSSVVEAVERTVNRIGAADAFTLKAVLAGEKAAEQWNEAGMVAAE